MGEPVAVPVPPLTVVVGIAVVLAMVSVVAGEAAVVGGVATEDFDDELHAAAIKPAAITLPMVQPLRMTSISSYSTRYNYALRTGRDFRLARLRDGLVRDALFMGTALSAPVVMLIAQGVVTTRLGRADAVPERLALGGLGAMMVGGYLGKSLVRQRLRPSGWDRVESP
jgi:hypothetical protein